MYVQGGLDAVCRLVQHQEHMQRQFWLCVAGLPISCWGMGVSVAQPYNSFTHQPNPADTNPTNPAKNNLL